METHIPGKRAVFIGHSMGGKVAMTAALRRPDLFEKIVVGTSFLPVLFQTIFAVLTLLFFVLVDIAPVDYSVDMKSEASSSRPSATSEHSTSVRNIVVLCGWKKRHFCRLYIVFSDRLKLFAG